MRRKPLFVVLLAAVSGELEVTLVGSLTGAGDSVNRGREMGRDECEAMFDANPKELG